MDYIAVVANVEIVEQPAIDSTGLRADARTSRREILPLDSRNQPLQGAHKRGLAERTVEFSQTGPPVLAGHLAKSWPAKSFPGVSQAEIGLLVSLACKREDGVRT